MLQSTLAALVFALAQEPLVATQAEVGANPKSPDQAARTPLQLALAASRQHGRPVLVFAVAPTVEGRRCQSRWLADLLVAGGADVLSDLALVELVFASVEQLAELDAPIGQSPSSASAALLERIDGVLVWKPIPFFSGPWCGATTARAERLGAEMELAARQLRKALRGDPDVVRRRADTVRSKLSPQQLDTIRDSIDSNLNPGRDIIERGAWIYRDRDTHSRAWEALLALIGEERFLQRPPLGARWFDLRSGELTVYFSDDDNEFERARLVERVRAECSTSGRLEYDLVHYDPCTGGPCGTGFASKRSYRFLNEYVHGLVLAPELE
jgi:hypothetical protein